VQRDGKAWTATALHTGESQTNQQRKKPVELNYSGCSSSWSLQLVYYAADWKAATAKPIPIVLLITNERMYTCV
jgi:hypothetical protein